MSQVSELLWNVVWLGIGGVAALFVAVVVGRRLRERLKRDQGRAPFTLQDLREMRSRGQISQQEFNAMRARLLGTFAADAGTPPQRPDASDAAD